MSWDVVQQVLINEAGSRAHVVLEQQKRKGVKESTSFLDLFSSNAAFIETCNNRSPALNSNFKLQNIVDLTNLNIVGASGVSSEQASDIIFNGTLTGVKFNKLWEGKFNDEVNAAPQIYDGVLYLRSSNGSIHAYNANDGKKLWRIKSKGEEFAPLYFYKGLIYAGSKYFIHVIDAKKGVEVWKRENPSFVDLPFAYHNEKIFMAAPPLSHMYVFDLNGKGLFSLLKIPRLRYSSVLYHDGNIYLVGNKGNLFAIDSVSSRERWMQSNLGMITVPPIFSNGKLYITNSNGMVHALDAGNGNTIWKNNIGGASIGTTVVQNDIIYTRKADGDILALNVNTGKVIWHYHAKVKGIIGDSMIVKDGALFFGDSDGIVYALDAANGKKIGDFYTNNSYTYMCADNENLYVITAKGNMYALKNDVTKDVILNMQNGLGKSLDAQPQNDDPKIYIQEDCAVIGETKVQINK